MESGLEIRDRIKIIRQELGMSQAEFGEKISLERSAISLIERKQRNATERCIKDICREFNVNENWLRTGEGNPFLPEDRETEILRLANKLLTEPDETFKATIISTILETNAEEWDVIEKIVKRIAKDIEKRSE